VLGISPGLRDGETEEDMKVMTCAFGLFFVLTSTIELSLDIQFWSFLVLLGISIVYYGVKLYLLERS